MYNFENYLLHPFLSLLVGIILILSVGILGFFFINLFLKRFTTNNSTFFLNSPLIGSNLLIFFLTPIVYLELHSYNFFKILSISLIIFSIFIIFKYRNNFIRIKLNKNYFLLYIILILLFLLCISPVTQADSLAYHMLGGVNYLIKGSLLRDLLPSEIKLVGSGELLIALGLSIGSEQFATLIQFSSISSIIYVFLNINKSNDKISRIMLIGVITTPVFLFLISSPKPQLMQIVNALFSSFLIYQIYKKKIPNDLISYSIFLIVFLLTLNVLVKYSFLLSSLLIGFVLFLVLLKIKKIHLLAIPILISFTLLVFPKYLFYFKYFDINFFTFLKSPLPINLGLYNEIQLSLRNISEGSRLFPTWLIFPKNLGLGGTIIGPIILSFFFFKIDKKITNIIVILLFSFFLILVLIYGQATSRFIFEGFVIVQLFLLLNKIKNIYYYKTLKYYVYFQSSIAIILLAYSITTLTPGAFSNKARTEVMHKNANGYGAMKWVNNNLKENEQILTSHRSKGLLNNNSYSLVFLSYLDKKDKNFFNYLNFLKKNDVRKAFIFDGFELNLFKDCLKKKIKTKKNIYINFGRNPFKDRSKIDAHIYEFDLENLDKCIN